MFRTNGERIVLTPGKVLNGIRLTRPVNLLIIAGTMLVIRYGVIGALVGASGLELQMPLMDFVMLILSTTAIAAGGNVINDYFDTRIDRVNKPQKVIVGRSIERRSAMLAHALLSGTGLILGLWVAWSSANLRLFIIPVFAVGALWSYSISFKRRFVIGNGTVAVLTALVPLTVGLYELPMLQRAYADELLEGLGSVDRMRTYFRVIWWWVAVYSAFAFLSTLVRELQKDMADVPGDRADGCRTVPIVLGVQVARWWTIVYILVLVGGILFLRRTFLHDPVSFWYLGLVVLALLLTAGLTFAAKDRTGHVRAGNMMKVAMVLAVGYGLLVERILLLE
ncbi:MAG: geranylgeranylglycerol-phosphate geranylgeranyltransferase [Flavobacteriales bacterium]|nr:geranylgeranylglycerol-phosphate geranylgeranyltransferase [Flavobacteriales bacterium]